MKYSFEEKKRAVSFVSVLVFLSMAGIIWLVSGSGRTGGADVPDSSGELSQYGDVSEGFVDIRSVPEIPAAVEAGEANAVPGGEPVVSVHVCGAVAVPGVYELAQSSRVGDAVEAAGGFKKNAAADYLNLAENIADGQKIVVYTKKQVRSFGGNGPEDGGNGSDSGKYTGGADSGLININTASKEELMTLQGIGESKASDIIAYRESNGRFNNTDELMNIPGIKEGVFSKISDSITV